MSDEYICKWTPPYEVFDGDGGYVQIGELIRCRDCRLYAYKYDGYHSECDLFKMCFDPDDYCSRAERKEDETD